MKFSIIIPVYKRPEEIKELLESLDSQLKKDFEVVIVEKISNLLCDKVAFFYKEKLDIKYFCIDTTGRSAQRNFGMSKASGDYFLLFDSDCVIPEDYILKVDELLKENFVDIFGGPDKADVSFTDMQKAINYSMTSFFTTGGIRGGMKDKSKFSPRSFNMGISKKSFEITGGFKEILGEDIDFSIRCKNAGLKSTLFTQAYVYHKRRIDLKRFRKQVTTFGRARIILSRLHPESFRIIHLLPSSFVLGHVLLLLFALVINPLWLLFILLYMFLLFFDCFFKTKKIAVAFLAVLASYIQLGGYGMGFIEEFLTHRVEKEIEINGQEAGYKF